MDSFRISTQVLEKLRDKHGVSREEVLEAFMNRTGPSFRDGRERHDTDPPSMWFCSLTDRNRCLKVVYVERDGVFFIKTAFEPKDGSDRKYEKLCGN